MAADAEREWLTNALAAGRSVAILSGIAHWVAMSGRGEYLGGDELPGVDIRFERLKLINEIQIILATQIHSLTAEAAPAYPQDALVEVLFERSTFGGIEKGFRWAIHQESRRS